MHVHNSASYQLLTHEWCNLYFVVQALHLPRCYCLLKSWWNDNEGNALSAKYPSST